MKVILYDEGKDDALDTGELRRYLEHKLGRAAVEERGHPLAGLAPDSLAACAARTAAAKVHDPGREPTGGYEPLYGEIEYEKRRIQGKTRAFGVIYDACRLRDIWREAVPGPERRRDHVHLILTNRLLATWDGGDRRYHLRTSLYGLPSIISTSGIVEAPARPKEYYLLKQRYAALGKDPLELSEGFRGQFIDYDDPRLTEVAKGYAMQAVCHALTGDPFCEDKGCRLYNAHWQAELILAQMDSGYEFCPRHAALLESPAAREIK